MPVSGIMNGVNRHFESLHFSWLMFLLLMWIGGSSSDPCAYLTHRLASVLLPSTVTLTALDDKGVETTHDKISFCRIKNGNSCMQGFKPYELTEYEAFEQMLKATLSFPPLQIQKVSGDHLDNIFKGGTCEEGLCGADDRCAPCSSCAKDYFRYQTVQRAVRREKTDKALKNEISDIHECGRVRGGEEGDRGRIESEKPGDFSLRSDLARIQIKKDGPEFLIQHCAIPDDFSCIPQSTREFEFLKGRLLTAKVVNSSLLNLWDLDNSPWTENPALAFKSWNCQSGVCDPKNFTCRPSRFPRRKYRVWKLYEYMNASSVAVPTIRTCADGMHTYMLIGYTIGLILCST